jgi:L-amino acid N-acyltransferase YncA
VPTDFIIQPLLSQHWPAVRRIYEEGIATGDATFETASPEWEKWDNGHRQDCRLVAVEPGLQRDQASCEASVLGWAALSPVSARHVYRGVAEVSVYVAASVRGHGVGKALLQVLVQESESAGIWTLQAGIFPENMASIALHKARGFHEVGIRRRIGKLGDSWRDVMLLERRSTVVGT